MNEDASAQTGRPLCPRCGETMNFHAEKIDPSAAETGSDGVVLEFHTCPGCKYVLERSVVAFLGS